MFTFHVTFILKYTYDLNILLTTNISCLDNKNVVILIYFCENEKLRIFPLKTFENNKSSFS